jgi:hypothetical protein
MILFLSSCFLLVELPERNLEAFFEAIESVLLHLEFFRSPADDILVDSFLLL